MERLSCRKCENTYCGNSGSGLTVAACNGYKEKKVRTNYDRLISKSREEMAEMMAVLGGCPLNVMTNCPKGHAPNEDCNAKRCWYDWLMQEVKE